MYVGNRNRLDLSILLFTLSHQEILETRPRALLAKAELINGQIRNSKKWQEWAVKANQRRIEQLRKEVKELNSLPVRFNSPVIPPQFTEYKGEFV